MNYEYPYEQGNHNFRVTEYVYGFRYLMELRCSKCDVYAQCYRYKNKNWADDLKFNISYAVNRDCNEIMIEKIHNT